MTARKQSTAIEPINPDFFYRFSEGPKYFGYGLTVLYEKIKLKEIPAPVALSDSGTARGWFGDVILKWKSERKTTSAKTDTIKAKTTATKEATKKAKKLVKA